MNCDFCQVALPDRVLVCPACHKLTYGRRLAARAREAEALEQRGEISASRDAWQETLTFLPEDAAQASEIRARVAKLDGLKAPRGSPRHEKGRAAGIAGVVGALLLGLKTKLALALSLVKGSKVLLMGATMAFSIWIYAKLMGLSFAALFVGLIWVHEMGHVVMLRYYGIRASAPVFIPFLGAAIRLKQNPKNVVQDAWNGLGGPIFGTIGGAITLALGRHLGSDLLFAAGFVTLEIQLFNLTPLYPLDGGRAAGVLTPRLWVLALVVLGALAWFAGEPVAIVAAFLPLGRIREGAKTLALGGPAAEFYRATPFERAAAFAGYLGLAALLVFAIHLFAPEANALLEKHGGTADLAWITSSSE